MDFNKFLDRATAWLISFGPRLLLAIVLVIAGLWVIKRLSRLLNGVLLRKHVDNTLRPFLTGSLSLVLQVLMVFAVMQVLGIQLTIFAALVGAFGVAAGLALSGTLQNFTSGILILLLKPFRAGDNIIAQGQEGTVSTIRIFYTVITTFDNRTVIIPNSKLSNEVIINLSREGKRRLDINLKFPFSASFDEVKPVLAKIIEENTELLKEPAMRIGVSDIEKDGYTVLINVWANSHGFRDVTLKLQEAIVQGLRSTEIKLPGM